MKLSFKQVNKMVWQDKKLRIILPTRIMLKAERERIYLLHKYHTYFTTSGEIIVLRTEENGQIVVIQVYPEIKSVLRAQFHILAQYLGTDAENGEINQLEDIDIKLGGTHAYFLSNNASDNKQTKKISAQLSNVADDLSFCRNLLKLETAGQVGEIIAMTDILDRPNPGALAARTVAALNRIQARKGQVQPIAAFIGARKQALIIEDRQQKHNLIQAKMFLKIMLASSEGFWKNKDSVNRIINRSLHQLQSTWTNPYFRPAKKAKDNLELAKKTNNYKNLKLTQEFVETAFNQLGE